MNRRLALSFLFVCGAAIAQDLPRAAAVVGASAEGVRFLSSPSVVALRVQVFSPAGGVIFDSDWKSGNVLDWLATSPIAYGSYRIVVESKDLAGQLSRKEATLRVDPNAISVDGQGSDSPRITLLAHDGQAGQLVTTSGDLSFRFGDYLNRKDTEAMRLSLEGNLDVKGWIRPGQGIVFADGSVLSSATAASIMRTRASRSDPEPAQKLSVRSNVAGTGTPNQVTKWLDSIGTLGNSAISEAGGAVTIGSVVSQGQLKIAGAAGQDVFAGMGLDLSNGPAFNFGYAGQTFGVGAGFFNVRPAAGATGVNPSLRFMTVNQQRMIVTNTGDVGIGTSSPLARLHVLTAASAGLIVEGANVGIGTTTPAVRLHVIGPSTFVEGGNAVDAMQVIAGNGGGNDQPLADGGKGGGILLQSGNGGIATRGGVNGRGGVISLQPGTPNGQIVMAGLAGTGVGIGDPTGYTSFAKLNVNGDVIFGLPGIMPIPFPRLMVYTPSAYGLRVETGTAGDRLASFGGLGRFEIDAPNVGGGRLEVTEAGNVGIGTNGPAEKLHVSGGKVRWSNSLLTEDQGGSIELGGTDTIPGGATATPYIDFHGQNAAGEDFNVRLINDANHMLHVVGGLTIDGPVIKPFGSFRIDHPLDPENKYLYHSFVESPDMKDIYDGVARVDEKGEVTVELPDWFEALNQDFRYQLTAIGKPSPTLYIAEEIAGNRFKIAGGTPGTKVSWQVTGIRHDAVANAHRIRVEEDKPAAERGKLAYPIDQQNRTN